MFIIILRGTKILIIIRIVSIVIDFLSISIKLDSGIFLNLSNKRVIIIVNNLINKYAGIKKI